MNLRDFQIIGRDFLIANDRALLLDDAGLGKSAEAITAADKLNLPRVLTVGPAIAGVSWPTELRKWSPKRRFVDLDTATNFGFDLPGWYFVSLDMLSQVRHADLRFALATAQPWDVLVIDEGQYLKSPGANRTRAIYGDPTNPRNPRAIAGNAKRVWVLSGTLTPNHAGEAYTHLRALFPDVLQDLPPFRKLNRPPEQHEFEDHYCRVRDTVYGRVIDGSRHQNELRQGIKHIMLRRRKTDVLPELPPIDFLTAPIRVSPADADFADCFVRDAEDQTAAPNVRDYARQQLGILKAPACAEWIRDRLEAGEPKIIVFAHHRVVLQRLYDGLLDYVPVLVHGDTSKPNRVAAVSRFQTNPNVRVFIGQIQAAGTAITLTAARTVFFAEFASTPGVNYQAASRAHRIGQPNAVQVYFGSVPGSLDEQIARTAARRAREISELFD